ncbi:vesicular glutamate transporter 3-like, partial [Tropilaelaps mercedesae]
TCKKSTGDPGTVNHSDKNLHTLDMDPLPTTTLCTRTGFLRHRYIICMLVFCGLALVYSMRVNMSVTVIAMVGSKGKNVSNDDDGTCPSPANEPVPAKAGEFNWDENLKGTVLYAFFVGYISTQILGGLMADKLSIKWVLGYGVFLTSVLTVITHWVARWSVYGLIILRMLEGVTEGVTYPSVYCLIARWAPASERTTMVNLCIIGSYIGTVITLPVAAALSESSLGWPAAFYIPGSLGIVWSLIWYICATSQPENHRWISDEEREYIIQNRGTSHSRTRKIPWMMIIMSRPVWLFAMARFCMSMTFYIFLTEMPTFIDSIFHISMTKNGSLNAFFYVCYACVAFLSGVWSDHLIKAGRFSRTTVRKMFECASYVISGVMLLLVTRIGYEIGKRKSSDFLYCFY